MFDSCHDNLQFLTLHNIKARQVPRRAHFKTLYNTKAREGAKTSSFQRSSMLWIRKTILPLFYYFLKMVLL